MWPSVAPGRTSTGGSERRSPIRGIARTDGWLGAFAENAIGYLYGDVNCSRPSSTVNTSSGFVLLCGGASAGRAEPPPESPAPAAKRGSVDKEVIRRTIRGHVMEEKDCYERELLQHPELTGRVIIGFRIGGDGHVLFAEVESSTLASQPVEQCIAAAVATWVFPKPTGGGVVKVSYPFVLKTEAPDSPPR